MPYDYFLKITGERNNSLQPVVPSTTPQLSMTAKAKSLLKNYNINSDSDMFTIPAVPNVNYAQKKQKFALWFVSNCHTKGSFKRLRLFQELRKYIPIDVYGHGSQCSEFEVKKDPCEGLDSDCSTKLMFTYKFYLSFENSECNYYITGIYITFIFSVSLNNSRKQELPAQNCSELWVSFRSIWQNQ